MNVTLLLVSLLACDVSTDAPLSTAPTPQPPPAAVAGMLHDAEDRAGYHYNPVGKRDPFRAFVDSTARHLVPPSAYRVLGIVWDIEQPQALVAAEDGRTFVIREGHLLGDSWSRVDRISAEGIEVVTQLVSLTGEEVEQRTVLRLREG